MKRQRKVANLRGLVSGRLVAVASVGRKGGSNTYWRCVCRCGARKEVRDSLLVAKRTKSCGCLSGELASARNRQHGKGRTPEAAVWRAMIARCHHPQSRAYRWYGARGIQVCQRWRDSFEAFLDDMGERPAGAHIDRTDNDGDYSPTNCRWATATENMRNRRDNVCLTLGGETKTLAEWAESTGIRYGTLWARVRRGWSAERALNHGT